MKIDSISLGKSFAVVSALIWVICSLLVMVVPGPMMSMSGDMMHMDFTGMAWTMNLVGFFIGLVIWTALAFVTGWAIGHFYNRFSPS
jgi:uncharacterized protein DUF5676